MWRSWFLVRRHCCVALPKCVGSLRRLSPGVQSVSSDHSLPRDKRPIRLLPRPVFLAGQVECDLIAFHPPEVTE